MHIMSYCSFVFFDRYQLSKFNKMSHQMSRLLYVFDFHYDNIFFAVLKGLLYIVYIFFKKNMIKEI